MQPHAHIVSRNLNASQRFYAAMAKSLGLTVIKSQDGFSVGQAGKGVMLKVVADGRLSLADDDAPESRPALVSLETNSPHEVKAFFREALRAGGLDVAYPSHQSVEGGRYAARVTDPDGNCIECASIN